MASRTVNTLLGFNVPLAVLHLATGVYFLLAGLNGISFRTEPGYRFAIAASSFLLGWALIGRRLWAPAALMGLFCSLLLFDTKPLVSSGQDPIMHGFISLWNFAIVGVTFLIGVGTGLFLTYQFFANDVNLKSRWTLLELTTLVVVVGGVVGLEGTFPRSVEVENLRLQQKQEAERDVAEEWANDEFDSAVNELQTAVANDDPSARRQALDRFWGLLRRESENQHMLDAVRQCNRDVQLALLHDGENDDMVYYYLRFLLEPPDVDDEVRRRFVVSNLKQPSTGSVRKLGGLKYVSTHQRIVWLLADTITDKESTTINDRVHLAEALQEVAELRDFDAKPAIPALEQVVSSDDDDRVRQAATIALEKAKLD